MFEVAGRDQVRERLLALAVDDPGVVGAAIIGSLAGEGGDRWSDLDLGFGVEGDLDAALKRWTVRLYRDFGALHHWDLVSGTSVYRVFLLPGWLEVDLSFTPAADFGPRGPRWRTVFGEIARTEEVGAPSRDHLVGLAWHHAWHAKVCIERHQWWQAEYWIGAVRAQVISLACLRLGYPTSYAKGAHLLPAEVTASLEQTLVRSVDEAELRRALAVAVESLSVELERTDPDLACRLVPALNELGASLVA